MLGNQAVNRPGKIADIDFPGLDGAVVEQEDINGFVVIEQARQCQARCCISPT